MAKIIAYTVIDNGVDGRERDRKVYSSYNEEDRDAWIIKSKNKNYRKDEEICEVENAQRAALAKLDALDRLVLSIEPDIFVGNVSVKNSANTLRETNIQEDIITPGARIALMVDKNLIMVKFDCYYAAYTNTGKDIIPSNYCSTAMTISNNLVAYKLDRKFWGMKDQNGKQILEMKYQKILIDDQFIYAKRGSHVRIHTHDGKEVGRVEGKKIYLADAGVLYVEVDEGKGKKNGLYQIDKKDFSLIKDSRKTYKTIG